MLEGALVKAVVPGQCCEGVAKEDIFGLVGPQQVTLKLHIFYWLSDTAARDVLAACAAVPSGGDRTR